MEGECAKLAGSSVLIVDDDFTTRLLARESLERAGFVVDETEDGRQALEVFDRSNPEIIILDVLMPGIDGYAVCKQIRRHPEGWNTPILMMTGLDDIESIKKAYDTGATDFISKPCNWLVLSYRVHYMLRASQILKDLSKSRASLNHAQHIAQIGSWEWDVKNDVLNWSEAAFRVFAIDPIAFDKNYHSFLNSVHPQDREQVDRAIKEALADSKQISIDHRILIAEGTTRYVHTEAKVICDKSGRPLWVTGTVQNITERKLQEEQIRELAYFDSLTGLPNRLLFKENLGHLLARAERSGHKVAMMFLDMDRFKEVNDTMGHDVGDQLLQGFAKRLSGCVRRTDRSQDLAAKNSDCLARLGGDEFTVILGDISRRQDVAKVAHRIVDTSSR